VGSYPAVAGNDPEDGGAANDCDGSVAAGAAAIGCEAGAVAGGAALASGA